MTGKRKGSAIPSAPPAVVVSTNQSHIFPSTFRCSSSPPLETPMLYDPGRKHAMQQGRDQAMKRSTAPPTWESTLATMQRLSSEYDKTVKGDINYISDCLSRVEMLENKAKEQTISEFSKLETSVLDEIEQAENSLRNENEDLVRHETHLEQLESELQKMRTNNHVLGEQRSQCRARIEKFKAESEQEIEKVDEIDAERISEATRIKTTISLLGGMTGIKWHYEIKNKLVGEVNLRSSSQVRRFEVDVEAIDPFDVARKVWEELDE